MIEVSYQSCLEQHPVKMQTIISRLILCIFFVAKSQQLPSSLSISTNTTAADIPCGTSDFSEIPHNDKWANIDEYPWMAQLIYENATHPVCEGALISNSFVVTAAHCLAGSMLQKVGDLKFVRLGEYDVQNDPDCIIINDQYLECTDGIIDVRPKSIIVHPDYQAHSSSQDHNIGLIELNHPVEFSDFIRHICLRTVDSGMMGAIMFESGWGRLNRLVEGELTSVSIPLKLKKKLTYIDHDTCSKTYRSLQVQLTSDQICAADRRSKDSYNGNIGSPLMQFDMKKAAWVLTGLRDTQHCENCTNPGIYTNVHKYVQWIKTNAQLQ
ncbi:CLIP domain-containing serine protease B8 [Aedes albopictus]|uniref:Peptidase S1 domain-containing protein n=1 Tax=Aedes albopictus TaxID=7160 RepID=A0ABM1ZV31_AEDAL